MKHLMENLGPADEPVPADIVVPDEQPRRAMIVVQEAFGVDDHILSICTRLAGEGYLSVAPHLFHRDGVNRIEHDMDAVRPHMANLTAEGIRSDVAAARDYLGAQGISDLSIGIIGFCMGGSVALMSAADFSFGAAVTFYGGGVGTGRFGYPPLIEVGPQLKAPWLGVFGDLDSSIPVEQVEALRSSAAEAAVPTSVVRYANAGHAFHCDTRPERYHAPSAKDAWAKTLDWLARYLEPVA